MTVERPKRSSAARSQSTFSPPYVSPVTSSVVGSSSSASGASSVKPACVGGAYAETLDTSR